MIRRPPRSTLFPTRRSSDLFSERVARLELPRSLNRGFLGKTHVRVFVELDPLLEEAGFDHEIAHHVRSEEHTSELQSHSDLVCRLLLEKKNNCETHLASFWC